MIGFRPLAEIRHEALHRGVEINDTRLVDLGISFVIADYPAIRPDLCPPEPAGLAGPRSGLAKCPENNPVIAASSRNDVPVLGGSEASFPRLRLWPFEALEGILWDDALFPCPVEHAKDRPLGVVGGCFPPLVRIDPAGDMVRLQVADKHLAPPLGEPLAVEAVGAVGVAGEVPLCPLQKGLDDVGHSGIGGLGSPAGSQHQLMVLGLGGGLVSLALDKLHLLAVETDHPPAGLLAKPGTCSVCHFSSSDQENHLGTQPLTEGSARLPHGGGSNYSVHHSVHSLKWWLT